MVLHLVLAPNRDSLRPARSNDASARSTGKLLTSTALLALLRPREQLRYRWQLYVPNVFTSCLGRRTRNQTFNIPVETGRPHNFKDLDTMRLRTEARNVPCFSANCGVVGGWLAIGLQTVGLVYRPARVAFAPTLTKRSAPQNGVP